MIVDGNEYGCWDGIVKIIYEDKCRTVIMVSQGEEDDEFLSLNDCLKLIGYKTEMGIVLVIIEDYLSGKIFQYGNNVGEPVWMEHGHTKGFA